MEEFVTNRLTVISGGASGIGRCVADVLAAQGDHVVIVDSNPVQASETADEINRSGASAEWLALDVTDREGVEQGVSKIFERHGRVDGLVTCAGITVPGPLESLQPSAWAKVLDVNLNGTFYLMQSVARQVLERRHKAAMVTVASVAAYRGEAGRGAYCVSKAGVIALTQLAAAEWSARGIRVNAIAPGYVDTPMLAAAIEEGLIDADRLLSRIPAGRTAQPTEIANAVRFLLDDDSSYMCGAVLAVDGGFLIDHGVPLTPAAK